MTLDRKSCYGALKSRDARFDGRFFTAVKTTGIYCRPICPAIAPKLKNVQFYHCAAAAEGAGYRPCRRCRPETSPGTPAWIGTSASVSRAINLIAEGALDGDGCTESLADRLGIGERHLRRLFLEHLGTTPGAIARTRRVHFARRLIDETNLPMIEVALSAGFSSVRRFNEAIKSTFGAPPGELRKKTASLRPGEGGLSLTLPYRPPFDWKEFMRFLAPRVTPGVEEAGDNIYRRTITVDGRAEVIEVRPSKTRASLVLTLPAPSGDLPSIVERVRRQFDLGADMMVIGEHLVRDRRLAPLVRARPGLRLPGAYDRFEMAVRAILGQQVSVRGATTLAGRLAERFGQAVESPFDNLTRLFPTPAQLQSAKIEKIGMPGKRAEAIRLFARKTESGEIDLDRGGAPEELTAALCAIPGIGEWTAEYVAMRAIPTPDAFPATDLGIRKALSKEGEKLTGAQAIMIARPWRPWRSYAVMHLWRSLS